MANYIYNGVELPQLPEWDKDTYPYALIGRKETDNSVVFCASSAKKVAWENGTVSLLSGIMYIPNNDVWEQIEFDGCNAYPFWTNTDINYQADGTLYLAASDPLPVGKPITDPLSFVMGCQLGCRLRAQRAVKKPIGYSYNGVVLPELPEWDKSKYPYAFIRAVADYGLYELYVFETEPYWFKSSIVFTLYGIEDGNTYLKASHYVGHSDYWDYSAPLLGQSALTERTSGGYVQKIEQIAWANYDILNEDKTIYLAASEPVPVYE